MATFEKQKLQAIEVSALCDCDGLLLPTGKVFTTYPAKHEHKCENCQKTYTFPKTYPTIEYEKI